MDRYARWRKLLAELSEKTVIVEGKKDVTALNSLDIYKIIPLSGKPLSTFTYNLYKNNVNNIVILTDYDRKGTELYKKLRAQLERYRLFVDSRLRSQLKVYGKDKVEDFVYVEEELKRGDKYGKTIPNFNKVHNKGLHKGQRHSGKARRDRGSVRPD